MFQPALTMNTVLACVDAHGHPSAVCDGATWVAHRLHAPLNFLQVVDEIPKTASEKPQERFLIEKFAPRAPGVYAR